MRYLTVDYSPIATRVQLIDPQGDKNHRVQFMLIREETVNAIVAELLRIAFQKDVKMENIIVNPIGMGTAIVDSLQHLHDKSLQKDVKYRLRKITLYVFDVNRQYHNINDLQLTIDRALEDYGLVTFDTPLETQVILKEGEFHDSKWNKTTTPISEYEKEFTKDAVGKK